MRACRQWKHLGLVSLCPRRNFSPFSLCEFGIRIFGRSSPWGLLEQDALILSQHAYFSDLCAFFLFFPRVGKYFLLIYLTSPVKEDCSFFFLLSSATAESLPFFIELYIELASPSVPEMPANVVLCGTGRWQLSSCRWRTLDTERPSCLMNQPETCSGDHCSLRMSSKTLQRR